MSDVTRMIELASGGNRAAADQLLEAVYDELRKLAAHRIAQEPADLTLQPTALVHEAYLRLIGTEGDAPNRKIQWDSRGHFFAAAAVAMRRILVEEARRRLRQKRGGDMQRVELSDPADEEPDQRLCELDAALNRLADEDPLAAKVVELHHFTGLSHEDVAKVLATTIYQARQKWTYARAWLRSELGT